MTISSTMKRPYLTRRQKPEMTLLTAPVVREDDAVAAVAAAVVPNDLVPNDLVPSDLIPNDLVASDLVASDWRGIERGRTELAQIAVDL